jgi:hypothetical protein
LLQFMLAYARRISLLLLTSARCLTSRSENPFVFGCTGDGHWPACEWPAQEPFRRGPAVGEATRQVVSNAKLQHVVFVLSNAKLEVPSECCLVFCEGNGRR